MLNAAELVQVRQDKGVQPGAEEPDWELIEKLEEIAEKDDVELPDVPEAPDLDAVAAQSSADVPAADAPSSSGDSAEWSLEEGEDLWPASSEEE